MSVSQSFTPSFARNDNSSSPPAATEVYAATRDFSGTASLLIGASHLNRQTAAGLSFLSDPPSAPVKLDRKKRQREDSQPPVVVAGGGRSSSSSPPLPPPEDEDDEEDLDDSGSDYDPSPRKAHPAKRMRNGHGHNGRPSNSASSSSGAIRASELVHHGSPVPSTISPHSYDSGAVTDLSGHSSIATAPYPATSPATFSSSAAGPGPHPHSYLPASWHQNPYHRPTSAASYPGAGPHDAVAGLYDTGTTTMASRFIDERNSGIAPSSINRAAPPPLSSAAAADFIQRPHPAAAAADGLSLPRPGPVQKKRGKLPEEAIQVMKVWLFANTHHPYPSDSQKREMCNQTGLSPQQVSNWFINARRRILKRANDDWPAQESQQSDSVSPEMPAARVPYERVPTELDNRDDLPPSPVFAPSNGPSAAGYFGNPAPAPQQRPSPPPQSYPPTAAHYAYAAFNDPQSQQQQQQQAPQNYGMPPPPAYMFGRQAHMNHPYTLAREPPPSESYARYSSNPQPSAPAPAQHYRASPYLRTPNMADDRPSSAQSSRSLDH